MNIRARERERGLKGTSFLFCQARKGDEVGCPLGLRTTCLVQGKVSYDIQNHSSIYESS